MAKRNRWCFNALHLGRSIHSFDSRIVLWANMNFNDKRHTWAFAIAGAIFFYALGAATSALFIIALPQDPDWCVDVIEIQTDEDSFEESCVVFKDEAAQLKHYHNLQMRQRNKYRLYFTVVFGALLGALLFHVLPRLRSRATAPNSLGRGLALGAVVAFLGPMVLGWLLPPPIDWFPRELAEIHAARQVAALRDLGLPAP